MPRNIIGCRSFVNGLPRVANQTRLLTTLADDVPTRSLGNSWGWCLPTYPALENPRLVSCRCAEPSCRQSSYPRLRRAASAAEGAVNTIGQPDAVTASFEINSLLAKQLTPLKQQLAPAAATANG